MIFGDKKYDLDSFDRILIVSIGKAAGLMALASAEIFGERVHAGIIVLKQLIDRSSSRLPEKFHIYQGNHPVPGPGSLLAGRAVLEFLETCTPRDLVLFLISGGGSALVTCPSDGITLDDIQVLNRLLLECGAAIDEINTIRKHLDRVKGGRLAKAAYPAEIVTLVLSDVVGNPLDMIASGPTVADPSTFTEAKTILKNYQLWQKIPPAISSTLDKGVRGEISETCKPCDCYLKNSHTVIVGSNYQAAKASLDVATKEGFNAQILTTCLQGDAFITGRILSSLLRQVSESRPPLPRPVCLLAGGETTVVVKGKGQGGRNIEVALGAVAEMDGLDNVAFVTLATDGEDGMTDAAGAVVTGKTYERALAKELRVETYRSNNDSYHYFKQLDALLIIGSTGTNVNDLNFLFAF